MVWGWARGTLVIPQPSPCRRRSQPRNCEFTQRDRVLKWTRPGVLDQTRQQPAGTASQQNAILTGQTGAFAVDIAFLSSTVWSQSLLLPCTLCGRIEVYVIAGARAPPPHIWGRSFSLKLARSNERIATPAREILEQSCTEQILQLFDVTWRLHFHDRNGGPLPNPVDFSFASLVVCGDLMRRESGAMPSALALDAPRAIAIESPMAMTSFSRRGRADRYTVSAGRVVVA